MTPRSPVTPGQYALRGVESLIPYKILKGFVSARDYERPVDRCLDEVCDRAETEASGWVDPHGLGKPGQPRLAGGLCGADEPEHPDGWRLLRTMHAVPTCCFVQGSLRHESEDAFKDLG